MESGSPPRPVGRGPKVLAAVHAAALAELADHGYPAISIEGIARRAGVHKTTVYRRWNDRDSLLLDALTARNLDSVDVPDTGALESDLDALAADIVATVNTPNGRALLAALQSGFGGTPVADGPLGRFFADRFARAAPVVTRAVARGEIPAGTDASDLVKTLIAPLYLRLLLTGEDLDAEARRQAVAVAVCAARAGVLRGE